MPNTRVRDDWEEKVKVLAEDKPPASARAIHTALAMQYVANRVPPVPIEDARKELPVSYRTVARIIEEWRDLTRTSDEERDRYRRFYWPESLGRLSLDRAVASRWAIELMRSYLPMAGVWERPPVRAVDWYCLISHSLHSKGETDLGVGERLSMARKMATLERRGELTERDHRALEGYLAFAPWRNEEAARAYEAATKKGLPPWGNGIEFDADADALVDTLSEFSGGKKDKLKQLVGDREPGSYVVTPMKLHKQKGARREG